MWNSKTNSAVFLGSKFGSSMFSSKLKNLSTRNLPHTAIITPVKLGFGAIFYTTLWYDKDYWHYILFSRSNLINFGYLS